MTSIKLHIFNVQVSEFRDKQTPMNLPANAGDTGSIPGSGDPLQKEMATHSNILAWEIPWTEEPGGLWGHKESDTT